MHFTALKEKQHIFFFYRISPTQTEIQSCCTSSEENVWARSFAAKQNKSGVLLNRIFLQLFFFECLDFYSSLGRRWLSPSLVTPPLRLSFHHAEMEGIEVPSSAVAIIRVNDGGGEWHHHTLRLKSWLIACEEALSWNDIRLRSCWQTALKHKNNVNEETRVSTDKKQK